MVETIYIYAVKGEIQMLKFVENNSEEIVKNLVSSFETALGETYQKSDERSLFLYQLAQVVVAINSSINDTGNLTLLRYARGQALDEIGDLLGVYRLPATSATCTMKFTLSAVQSTRVTIPKGTRVTPDGEIYFATTSDLVIKANTLSGEVEAKATTAGSSGNDYTVGSIRYIVDNVQYLSTVENTDKSIGGTDEESDDSLRERIRLVPESFSTAGCAEGYEYFAKTASADVGDVIVYSPVNDTTLTEEERKAGAGHVYIYVMKADGTIPNEGDEILSIVAEAVTAKDKRPLTDFVTVLPPQKATYSIKFDYYIAEEDENKATDIETAVDKAVAEYIQWQSAKIGRDINPDKLRNLVYNAGASRIEITSPTYTTLNKTKIAALNGAAVYNNAGFTE